MKLEDFLQNNYGYNPEVKNNIETYITKWRSWYKGNVADFHTYQIYNGIQTVNQERLTMNMAKKISEDWSDILWSEKCEVSMKDETNQAQYNELLDKLDLNVIINQSIEKSGALGTCANVISVYDIIRNEDKMTLDVSEAKTRIDIVDVDWIYPLTWNNKEITECAFGSVEYVGGKKYVVCSVHQIADNGNYVIKNHLFSDSNGNLTEIIQEEGTITEFDTQNNIKWFSIFKPLLTNNLFDNSPFGIPHYANAIDNLKAVDCAFDMLKNEVIDGQQITFVSADMLNYDSGEQRLTFDPQSRKYYVLPKGANKEDMIQNNVVELRTSQFIETLNTNLNMLASNVGFGDGFYKFDGENFATATQVVSSNSKMFRRKKKLEIGYESAIYDLIKGVCYASSQFGQYNIDTNDIVIQFDDSIVEDTEAIANRKLREVNAGLISKAEYREVVLGESVEIAEEAIRKIEENEASVEDLINEQE